jgi:tRNA (guanine-N7-)-methyltransferase
VVSLSTTPPFRLPRAVRCQAVFRCLNGSCRLGAGGGYFSPLAPLTPTEGDPRLFRSGVGGWCVGVLGSCYLARVAHVGTEERRRYADAPRLPGEGSLRIGELLPKAVHRIEIEVGPGRGGFLFERLQGQPNLGMMAFEVSRKWTTLVNQRLARLGLADRGRVFAEDARLALPRLEPPGEVACIYFHFPDPWWKKRHQKRLVMGSAMLDQAARLLRPGGELFVQTDVDDRAELYETQISGHAAFEAYGEPTVDATGRPSARLSENPYGARSHRERRAIDDAIPIYRLRFRRVTP